ncbi:mannose-6-phosphate isomerase, class I [Geosporobacter ferrireducens]|uniref:mannose-6-phosphate isomerase n=1 Tax=Geosporobacter ferrireducens TaxID=1424294 RepID=A0A1D8GHL7_9FIRM|nr:mannose-6-phosphate isomerase, class I [Geosporobacter ferrireducens]AOT70382.1 mannose-6-phosphate isomerase, class I [Geosporobacter ferrireducens]MTI57224.1 mannose-6-phosphate isomerase, class I [Geosporobacter ferrireducens]
MYPLKFEHIYVDKVWGGRNLSTFRTDLPKGDIGESWELVCRSGAVSKVANGEYSGLGLNELIRMKKEALVGHKISIEQFPLLVKFLDARIKLSIQVHPDDNYAAEKENDLGKMEAWVVLEAAENANMILGFKDCSKNEFLEAIEDGSLEDYLNVVPVNKGDVFFIPSGLIHSMEGVVVAEIQQNSDTTYRVYDYNRGRELHVDKAVEVVDFSLEAKKIKGIWKEKEGYKKIYYCYNPYFSLEQYEIKTFCTEKSNPDRFYIFTCIEGSGKIVYEEKSEEIIKGDTVLIPACLGEYTLEGPMSLLKSYVPDIEALESEILDGIKHIPKDRKKDSFV